MIDDIKIKATKRMDKSVEAFVQELKTIRTGRASLFLLDHIKIECYGDKMPINQLANLSIPEPRTISIEPWDKSVMQDIEKGLLKSDLNITPINDGKVIRLVFPSLTEERRLQLVKQVKLKSEPAKVAIRNIRRDANEELKALEKEGHISKDDVEHAHNDVQKLTDSYIEKINHLTENKEQEIIEI